MDHEERMAAAQLQAAITQLRETIAQAANASDPQSAWKLSQSAHRSALESIEKLGMAAVNTENALSAIGTTMQVLHTTIGAFASNP